MEDPQTTSLLFDNFTNEIILMLSDGERVQTVIDKFNSERDGLELPTTAEILNGDSSIDHANQLITYVRANRTYIPKLLVVFKELNLILDNMPTNFSWEQFREYGYTVVNEYSDVGDNGYHPGDIFNQFMLNRYMGENLSNIQHSGTPNNWVFNNHPNMFSFSSNSQPDQSDSTQILFSNLRPNTTVFNHLHENTHTSPSSANLHDSLHRLQHIPSFNIQSLGLGGSMPHIPIPHISPPTLLSNHLREPNTSINQSSMNLGSMSLGSSLPHIPINLNTINIIPETDTSTSRTLSQDNNRNNNLVRHNSDMEMTNSINLAIENENENHTSETLSEMLQRIKSNKTVITWSETKEVLQELIKAKHPDNIKTIIKAWNEQNHHHHKKITDLFHRKKQISLTDLKLNESEYSKKEPLLAVGDFITYFELRPALVGDLIDIININASKITKTPKYYTKLKNVKKNVEVKFDAIDVPFEKDSNSDKYKFNWVHLKKCIQTLIQKDHINCISHIQTIWNHIPEKPQELSYEMKSILHEDAEKECKNFMNTFDSKYKYIELLMKILNSLHYSFVCGTNTKNEIIEMHKIGKITFEPIPEPVVIQPTPSASSSSSSSNAENNVRMCEICYDKPIDCALDPCGHEAMCIDCCKKIQNTTGKCPICRKQITKPLKVYKS
jgi:hypothetical protein